MKDDLEQLGRRHGRAASGSGKRLGQLNRIYSSKSASRSVGKFRRSRRRRESFGVESENKAKLVRWSIGFGALSIALIVGLFSVWVMRANHHAGEVTSVPMHEPLVGRISSPPPDEARKFVRQGLALRDADRMEDYFRLGAVSREEAMHFLRESSRFEGDATEMIWVGSMDVGELPLEGVIANFSRASGAENHLVLLTPNDEGAWRIDYDAFARVVAPSWSTMLEQDAAEGLVRVHAKADCYFNGPFAEGQWDCYRLSSPDIDRSLYGYCPRNSPQAWAMREAIGRKVNALPMPVGGDQGGKRVTLMIHRVEQALPRQFEIVQVLSQEWVLSNEAHKRIY